MGIVALHCIALSYRYKFEQHDIVMIITEGTRANALSHTTQPKVGPFPLKYFNYKKTQLNSTVETLLTCHTLGEDTNGYLVEVGCSCVRYWPNCGVCNVIVAVRCFVKIITYSPLTKREGIWVELSLARRLGTSLGTCRSAIGQFFLCPQSYSGQRSRERSY